MAVLTTAHYLFIIATPDEKISSIERNLDDCIVAWAEYFTLYYTEQRRLSSRLLEPEAWECDGDGLAFRYCQHFGRKELGNCYVEIIRITEY